MCLRCNPHPHAPEQQFVHALHDWRVRAIAADVNHTEGGVAVFPIAAPDKSFRVRTS